MLDILHAVAVDGIVDGAVLFELGVPVFGIDLQVAVDDVVLDAAHQLAVDGLLGGHVATALPDALRQSAAVQTFPAVVVHGLHQLLFLLLFQLFHPLSVPARSKSSLTSSRDRLM